LRSNSARETAHRNLECRSGRQCTPLDGSRIQLYGPNPRGIATVSTPMATTPCKFMSEGPPPNFAGPTTRARGTAGGIQSRDPRGSNCHSGRYQRRRTRPYRHASRRKKRDIFKLGRATDFEIALHGDGGDESKITIFRIQRRVEGMSSAKSC